MNIINQAYELVPVGALKPHPKNPRKGDIAAIGESIAANGFYGSVVAQRATGFILAGNHRLKAAIEQGATEVPVIYVDADDEQATRILLADNRTNDLSGYDDAALAELLKGLDSLDGTGYDQAAVDKLLSEAIAKDGVEADGDQWTGMPDFDQENKIGNKLTVYFASQDDRIEFGRVMGQKITEKTTMIWFPESQKESFKDARYSSQ